MSIPKIIHYCWLGGKSKPESVQKYISNWKKVFKDYQIIEWNEHNADFSDNAYAKKNYEQGKFAFVTDYIRLKALYNFGGIYLDTDVEVKKNFNDFLANKVFFGFMFDCNLSTAIIGAEKNSSLIKSLLGLYENKKLANSPNNDMYTQYFLSHYPEFKLNGKFQVLADGTSIYPKEYFEQPTFNKKVDYSVHHFHGSWYGKKVSLTKKMIKHIIGNVLYAKLSHMNSLKISPFYQTYLNHSRKNKQ